MTNRQWVDGLAGSRLHLVGQVTANGKVKTLCGLRLKQHVFPPLNADGSPVSTALEPCYKCCMIHEAESAMEPLCRT